MPLPLKTMEVQMKGNQWNKRFISVQVNRSKDNLQEHYQT